MDEIILVATTFETKQDAEKVASIVLEKRLAGCAQISGPATSIYWWQGTLEKAQEYILTLKSHPVVYEQLENALIDNHPYETPEIIATTTSHCSSDYKRWLDDQLNISECRKT